MHSFFLSDYVWYSAVFRGDRREFEEFVCRGQRKKLYTDVDLDVQAAADDFWRLWENLAYPVMRFVWKNMRLKQSCKLLYRGCCFDNEGAAFE